MFNTIVGAGAASRYGSDQKMRLLAGPAPQHWLQLCQVEEQCWRWTLNAREMLLPGTSGDEHSVREDKNIRNIKQDPVHQPLECYPGVFQAERHPEKLEETKRRDIGIKLPMARTYVLFLLFLLVHTEKAGGTLPFESANLGLYRNTHDWSNLPMPAARWLGSNRRNFDLASSPRVLI
jgi:hypothetical protein